MIRIGGALENAPVFKVGDPGFNPALGENFSLKLTSVFCNFTTTEEY